MRLMLTHPDPLLPTTPTTLFKNIHRFKVQTTSPASSLALARPHGSSHFHTQTINTETKFCVFSFLPFLCFVHLKKT